MRGGGHTAAQDTGPRQQQEDPSPENVLSGLRVHEKNLRELRRSLFTRLFQLQAEEAVLRAKLPEDLQRQYPPGGDVSACEPATTTTDTAPAPPQTHK